MPGLVRALAASRERLSQELYRVVADWERTTAMVAEGGVEFVLEAEKRPLVDYLQFPFESADPLYEQLFTGEKLKQLHHEALQGPARAASRARVVDDEKRVFHDVLAPQVDAAECAALADVLERAYAPVLAEGEREARVLLVGDCLYLDIVTFAQPALAAEGITLVPSFASRRTRLSSAARSRPIRPGWRSKQWRRRRPDRRLPVQRQFAADPRTVHATTALARHMLAVCSVMALASGSPPGGGALRRSFHRVVPFLLWKTNRRTWSGV
jgi:hypothetical protein